MLWLFITTIEVLFFIMEKICANYDDKPWVVADAPGVRQDHIAVLVYSV